MAVFPPQEQTMTPAQQATPAQVIESVYAAFNRGDIGHIVNLVAPNATWRQPGSLPWGGDYTGPQGAAEFFSKLAATMRTVAFEPKESISTGNEVFSFGDYEAVSLKSGKSARARWAFRWRVEGGKIVAYDSYMDTAAILAAL
jgi:ketosteroid isomerase-like protein